MESEEKPFNPWYYYLNNMLIKKLKPCAPGDQVHIKKWKGCYTIHKAIPSGFTIMKNREFVKLPWDEYVCHKGQGSSELSEMRREIKMQINLSQDRTDMLTRVLNELKGMKELDKKPQVRTTKGYTTFDNDELPF